MASGNPLNTGKRDIPRKISCHFQGMISMWFRGKSQVFQGFLTATSLFFLSAVLLGGAWVDFPPFFFKLLLYLPSRLRCSDYNFLTRNRNRHFLEPMSPQLNLKFFTAVQCNFRTYLKGLNIIIRIIAQNLKISPIASF